MNKITYEKITLIFTNFLQYNSQNMSNTTDKKTLIFVYGTLKRNFPNHKLIETLTTSNDAVFVGTHKTTNKYPLVHGPLGVPFLINKPGVGCHVRGELYSVSSRALARLDALEGIGKGHYERLSIAVESEDNKDVNVGEVEAYFADKSYADEMWDKSGKNGIQEYLLSHAESYVGLEDRNDGLSLRDHILLWLKQ